MPQELFEHYWMRDMPVARAEGDVELRRQSAESVLKIDYRLPCFGGEDSTEPQYCPRCKAVRPVRVVRYCVPVAFFRALRCVKCDLIVQMDEWPRYPVTFA